MQRNADVVVSQHNTVFKVGEIQIEEDGTFTGKISENKELALPARISESTQPFVLNLIFLSEPIRYSRTTS